MKCEFQALCSFSESSVLHHPVIISVLMCLSVSLHYYIVELLFQLSHQVEVLQDKMVCCDSDLVADMDRWNKQKRADFKQLFVRMADRQITYYQKVFIPSSQSCNSFDLSEYILIILET